ARRPSMHVLVVEDEESVRRAIARNLEKRGNRVSEARTVAWGAQICDSDPPDVMVLDINLPDGSGWDVLREIEARHRPRPAVVVISAVPPSRTRMAEFAPLTFLPKPFSIDALLRAVGNAAVGNRSHEKLDRFAI